VYLAIQANWGHLIREILVKFGRGIRDKFLIVVVVVVVVVVVLIWKSIQTDEQLCRDTPFQL